MQPVQPPGITYDTWLILVRLNELEETIGQGSGLSLRWRIGPVTYQPEGHQTPPASVAGAGPTEGEFAMADLVLTADQQARLQAAGVDADGNPVDLTGAVAYACDNQTVLTLTDHGDGTALIVTTGPVGSALVTATGEGPGGQPVLASLAVDVTAGQAVSVQIEATVEPQGTP